MQIKYKPSRWNKLPFLSKVGLVIFNLSIVSGFTGGIVEAFDSNIIHLPDYWLFLCIIVGFLGFSVAAIFDKDGKIDSGVLKK